MFFSAISKCHNHIDCLPANYSDKKNKGVRVYPYNFSPCRIIKYIMKSYIVYLFANIHIESSVLSYFLLY